VDILFVEDDPHDAELAKDALKGITNWVQVVRDGQAALDFLFCQGEFAQRQSNQRPQLVLLDLELPKIGGLEVLRRVKSDPRTATIPVVVLTGSDSDRDIRTSKRLGAAAYIVKPVEMGNLAHVTPILQFQWALVKPLLPTLGA
jgi:CheY-like chemotaxis protein